MRSGSAARRSSKRLGIGGSYARGGPLPGGPLLEAGHELVEAQLLEAAPDGVELAGAELHEAAALAHERERLAQPRLARVQAADDRLQAGGRVLVGELVRHRRRWWHPRRRRRSAGAPRRTPAPPRRW